MYANPVRDMRAMPRAVGLAVALVLALGSISPPSTAAVTTGKVKRIAKKQIKKLVPKMIDAATIDQGLIPPVTASITDPNVTILTKGPFTLSLDCSDAGGSVELKLLVRTTEENSVVNHNFNIRGDLDPADGDQTFVGYTGNPPGGDAETDYPYYQAAFFRSPSGTHFWAQFDTMTNHQGSHCYLDGWVYDLTDTEPALGATGTLAAPSMAPTAAPVTAGRVKKIAKKQIKKLVPKMIDAATFEQGVIPPITMSVTDPNKTVFTKGPFTVSMDCSLSGGGDVILELLARTTEENSVVNDSDGWISGDLDPADGDKRFMDFTNPPGGDPYTGGVYDEAASFRSPTGTHLYVQFDTGTNVGGSHCSAGGWFLDLAGAGPTSGTAGKVAAGAVRPAASAGALAGATVKKIIKKQIKKLVPKMIDAATIDQGLIPPVTASITDPNKTVFTKGPFTISLDCSLISGFVDLRLLGRTTEENSVVTDGWGSVLGDLDPADGDQTLEHESGDPPGGDADAEGVMDEYAIFRSPSGTHFYGQFDAVTNHQGNHCFVDGWFLDLAG